MYKVITTARRSGAGTVSREHIIPTEPSADRVRELTQTATDEFYRIFGEGLKPIVEITIRRDDDSNY